MSELKRKSTVQAKETVAKRTTKRNVKDMVSKANTTKGAMKETSSSSENGGSIIDLSETENVAEKVRFFFKFSFAEDLYFTDSATKEIYIESSKI